MVYYQFQFSNKLFFERERERVSGERKSERERIFFFLRTCEPQRGAGERERENVKQAACSVWSLSTRLSPTILGS